MCVILRSRDWRSHCRQLEINWRRAENYSRPMRMVYTYLFSAAPLPFPPLPRLISHLLFVVVATVIGWLNKQINDQMLGGRVPPPGPASLPLSTIRHSSPLTSSPHMVCKCHSFLYKDKLDSNLFETLWCNEGGRGAPLGMEQFSSRGQSKQATV